MSWYPRVFYLKLNNNNNMISWDVYSTLPLKCPVIISCVNVWLGVCFFVWCFLCVCSICFCCICFLYMCSCRCMYARLCLLVVECDKVAYINLILLRYISERNYVLFTQLLWFSFVALIVLLCKKVYIWLAYKIWCSLLWYTVYCRLN